MVVRLFILYGNRALQDGRAAGGVDQCVIEAVWRSSIGFVLGLRCTLELVLPVEQGRVEHVISGWVAHGTYVPGAFWRG